MLSNIGDIMIISKIHEYKGGWFLGNFEPALIKTELFEVAVKKYKAGEKDPAHTHKIATELTYVAKGKCKFNNNIVESGTLVLLEPGEYNTFEAITDVELFVVKFPSLPEDKYIL